MLGAVLLLTCFLYTVPCQGTAPPDEVRLRVSVLDAINRYVTDLESQHFRIYEGRARQPVTFFASKTAPLSVAIILNTVEDPRLDMAALRKVWAGLLDTGNAEDEVTLVTLHPAGARMEKLDRGKPSIGEHRLGQVAGLNALTEVFYLALKQVESNAAEKKAVIAVGDAAVSHMLRPGFKEPNPDIQLYAIQSEAIPSEVSVQWAARTGGRAYTIYHLSELEYYFGLIYSELRYQYVLGYRRTQRTAGKKTRLSVRLDLPKGSPAMTIRMRQSPSSK